MQRVSILAGSALLGFMLPGIANAVPALGDPYEIQQSDGTVFIASQQGDEWRNWVENQAGFAVAPDMNGIWRYVKAYDVSGNPTLEGTPATGNPPPGLAKHLSPPTRRPAGAPGLGTTGMESAVDAGPSAAPVQSTRPILFILAQFTDISGSTTPSSWGGFVANNIGDYFSSTSHGNALVHGANETGGTANDGVVGWVNINYAHPDTRDNTGTANKQLARDAIAAADPYVNYASYDANGDGYVEGDELGVVVIAAGYERSYSSSYVPNVWGHRWNTYITGSGYALADGVRITDYAQFGELHATHQATMGIMVHELGHLIYGLPDLYDTDGSSSGIGAFGLMGSGSWGQSNSDAYAGETPVNTCAWTKKTLSWVSVVEGSGTPSIVASGDVTSPEYRVYSASTGDPNQYFLVENRQPQGYDLGLQRYLGTSFGGLAIWHIDDSKSSNTNDAERLVDLEEADGNQMGSSRGYPAALWSSATATTFDDNTTPSSRLHNGSTTGVSVSDISGSGPAMTATFGGAAVNDPPTADFSSSVSGLTATFTDTSSDSDGSVVSWTWNFGDGGTSMQRNPSHAYAAGGTYDVTLTVTDDDGDTDTATTPVTVTDPGPQPPAAPSNLTADVQFTGKGKTKVITGVTLHWTDNADNETGFEVERCQEITSGKGKNRTVACDYAAYQTVGADVTDLDVPTDSGYRYRVKAVNDIGSSDYSNEVGI